MLDSIKFVLLFAVLHLCECDLLTSFGCENDKIYLACKRNEVIKIESVFYGRKSKPVCPSQYVDKYEHVSSKSCVHYISDKCNDKASCKIRVRNSACHKSHNWYPKTSKHMVIKYKCISAIPPPPHIDCAPNRVIKYNALSCEGLCPSARRYIGCFLIKGPTCVCRDGLLLDERTNNCVVADKCPYYNPKNPLETTPEQYEECGRCDACRKDCTPILCTLICQPGYYCKPGYCRKNGLCVRNKCFKG